MEKKNYKLWIILEEYDENENKTDDIETVKLLDTDDRGAGYDAFLTAQAATFELIKHTHGKHDNG